MADQPPIPPLARIIVLIAILLNLVVFTGLSRAGLVMILMLFANIAVCGVAYFLILRHFGNRLP